LKNEGGNSASNSEAESDEEDFNKPDADRDLEPSDSEDGDFWDEDGPVQKKETLLDTEPTNHHEVHCPHYPHNKYEWWFLYMTEKKSKRLVSMIVSCKTLDKEKTVELRFSAPPQKGVYFFNLVVRSDSYMDSDYTHEVKMEVHPAREPVQIKYEDTDDADDGECLSHASSDDYTEVSAEEDEDA